MVESFFPLQQPLGSNSCLPTAIISILRNQFGSDVVPEDVSDWCREDSLGCDLDLAVEGLRENGWSMQRLVGDPEAEMRAHVNDPDKAVPVIAIVSTRSGLTSSHAVVVLGFEHLDDGSEEVAFMDPRSGDIDAMAAEEFLKYWDFAGQIAFYISE
jgi:hypothetical protein